MNKRLGADQIKYYSPPLCLEHSPGSHHPEAPERIVAINKVLKENGLLDKITIGSANLPDSAILELVHHPSYIKQILGLDGLPKALDSDTIISPGSVKAALMAVGATLSALESVLFNICRTAFCAVRPPGHHATSQKGMGFCLFNNVAIAAAAAIANFPSRIKRVMIIDYDVHHGNGTEQSFYNSSSVYYISIHQYPFYPGTGHLEDRGSGEGEGYNLNIPLPAGVGDQEYLRAFSKKIVPVLESFNPNLVIFSAGFDAHEQDPLGLMKVSTKGFDSVHDLLLDKLQLLNIPYFFVLEGGYNLQSLSECTVSLLQNLVGRFSIS